MESCCEGTFWPTVAQELGTLARPTKSKTWVMKAKARKQILSEEEYLEGLQTVIQRDFFPDLEKLQAQKEYLEAEESGNLELMRQISIELGKSSRDTPLPYVTPPTFETPEVHPDRASLGTKPELGAKGPEEVSRETQEEEAKEPLPGLDAFLTTYTSEDNASFEKIMEVSQEKEQARHAWLYEMEEQDTLASPSREQQALQSSQARVEAWKYKAKNSLMYYPEGVPDREAASKKPRQVLHRNTRFLREPFSKALSFPQLQKRASLQNKVGPDGKELIPQDSPKVNGFGFVATPSPAPGVNESPMMTWGKVESTPLRIDGSDIPSVNKAPVPAFKILEPGRRERLGLKMSTEAAAKNRGKKQEALRKARENLASLTSRGLSPAMTPALQRLMDRTAGKYTDKALRASYTPSPVHPGHKTPAGGPHTPTRTPGSGTTTRTPLSQDPASITDNLLHFPKRRKASDFF